MPRTKSSCRGVCSYRTRRVCTGDEPLLVQGIPEGQPLRAVVHGEHGPIQEVEIYKQDLEDGSEDAFMLTIPQPDPSWRAIEVPGLLAPQAF